MAGWHRWRAENLGTIPDLSGAILGGADLSRPDLNSADLSGAILSDAYLGNARLSGADLSNARLRGGNLNSADLRGANLNRANLNSADLSGANLNSANLNSADLRGANLNRARLYSANLRGANLVDADFTKTIMAWTELAQLDLSEAKGLSSVVHGAPSTIGIDTLEQTASGLGTNPSRQGEVEKFLLDAGLPNEYWELFRSRIGSPIQFYSVFISYSSKDQKFADRLHADLRSKDVRCWLATEDLKIGDSFRSKINDAIRFHDKLLVVLSKDSVASDWVEDEVEAAFEREQRDGKQVLFPLRIDDAVLTTDAAWASSIRRRRHIGDFTGWKNHDSYQAVFDRVLRDLQADVAPPPTSSP